MRTLGPMFGLLLFSLAACDDSAGSQGPRGPTGTSGADGADGNAGADGANGQMGTPGLPGTLGPGPLVVEPNGVVGRISSRVAGPLGGTVYLVPSAAVAALQAIPIDLQMSSADTASFIGDEPIEDLIDENGATYTSAAVDTDNVYRIASVADGRYFLVWFPAPDDRTHLPGGDFARFASDAAEIRGKQVDIKVSGNPSAAASFVGSTTCLTCHFEFDVSKTAHFNGFQVPGARAYLQDTQRWPEFDDALTLFEAQTTLYYWNCNPNASGFSKCRVTEVPPAATATVSFEIALSRDTSMTRGAIGSYSVELRNRRGPGTAVFPVELTYGGAVYKQRFLTPISNANGTVSRYMLPIQFNYAGNDGNPSSNDWRWRDYNSAYWYDYANLQLSTPAKSKAFDNNCAGCHFNGYSVEGNANDGWVAKAVRDLSGTIDYDGDGVEDEINLGCESCHGPGSEHLSAAGRGGAIVALSLLTSEREAAICGSCHSRPKGIGGGVTDAPLNAAGHMPRPGIRRAEYAELHTSRVDGAPTDFYASGDSKSHHQQYSDFIRSDKYRNGIALLSCATCHDAHGSTGLPNQVRTPSDDNASCTGCHNTAEFTTVRTHVQTTTGNRHDGVTDESFVCVQCHMVKSASSGAKRPELLDELPTSDGAVQYFAGDISNHRFNVTGRDQAAAQPVVASLSCGTCHATFLPNP